MPGTWWTENDRENKSNYGTIKLFECMKKMNFIKTLLLSVWSISIIGCNNATTNDKDIKPTTESVTNNNIPADSLVYVVNDVKLPFEIYSALDRNKIELKIVPLFKNIGRKKKKEFYISP